MGESKLDEELESKIETERDGTKIRIECETKIKIKRVIGIKLRSSTDTSIQTGTRVESGTRIEIYLDRDRVRNQKQECNWHRERERGQNGMTIAIMIKNVIGLFVR
ncbi:hypothetical protein EVAR_15128_1 [Eumeta japonica]|uniref:Uncharacterized protein n=1 Tax=Eumeta variegata TaxID=151549 RepID=A0A4C1UJP6_EUMVA|nr:hypothetical protein EVAR_15128_1 [Eumeta japonica]